MWRERKEGVDISLPSSEGLAGNWLLYQNLCCSCQVCFQLTVKNVLQSNIFILGKKSDKASQSSKISFIFALPGLFRAVWAPFRMVFALFSLLSSAVVCFVMSCNVWDFSGELLPWCFFHVLYYPQTWWTVEVCGALMNCMCFQTFFPFVEIIFNSNTVPWYVWHFCWISCGFD